jgi:hypothetical protein
MSSLENEVFEMTQNTAESRSKIDVREAARIARDYVKHVFADEHISGIQLEEIELSEDEKYWYVTIGFDTNRRAEGTDLGNVISYPYTQQKYIRDYKLVTIRASDGEVESIKIRQI